MVGEGTTRLPTRRVSHPIRTMLHSFTLIHTMAAALGLALALGFVATRLRLPALVGYLLAGVVIGPYTPGFVAGAAMASQLAEIA